MANRKSYKVDESFLEKISIGAAATTRVFSHLESLGHNPIELERGSMSYKIWKEIKIKRLRVPDLLCVNCAKRIESRGKTNLEITMSHSFASPERGWDAGLNSEDYVALVKCVKIGERPIDWSTKEPVQYISVSDMSKAFKAGQTITERPKGATEGFEARITWPSSKANAGGQIYSIENGKVKYKRDIDSRSISLSLQKKGRGLTPLVRINERVVENQIIASVVPVALELPCNNITNETFYQSLLASTSLADRYSAAKVLHLFPSDTTTHLLKERVMDEKEHIYVRLEAASSLLKMKDRSALPFFESAIKDEYLQNRLETTIILGEIRNDEACSLLIKALLDKKQHPEIRAGAAWSLGELDNSKALSALVKVFNEVEYNIKAEAARALKKLSDKYPGDVVNMFPESNEQERAGVAWALSKSGRFNIEDLIPVLVDDEARKWTAWIIGTQDQVKYVNEIEKIKEIDSELYFAVTVLWKILSSWVSDLNIY
ncbi:MAG: HEAT repeat domain-containing protein [Desulfarculus sp.]|jgi:HEAT repeat protein|nr:MAG: HEAT repeat domain-containing protein [Desulfarculus sp.]